MTAVFLDLDGTLMDSKPGIVSSLSAAFIEVGRPDLAQQDLTWMIGPPFADSFPKLGLTDTQAAIDAYRHHYDDAGMYNAQVYDGVHDMLAALLAAGHRPYLATAKPHEAATKITAHFGIAPSMIAEFGPEMDGTHNFKGDLLAHALQVTGEDPANSVMIGDRHHDMKAAAFVGMPSIAVRWGYGSPDEWEGARKVIDHPSEIITSV